MQIPRTGRVDGCAGSTQLYPYPSNSLNKPPTFVKTPLSPRGSSGSGRRISSFEKPGVTSPAVARAVHHDAAQPRRDGRVTHQLAEHRARDVAARAHDDHIPRLGDLQRLVHHQIVRGTAVHGDGEAAQGQPAACLNPGVHEGEAAHRIGEVGTGETAEALDQIAAEPRRRRQDPEPQLARHAEFS